MVEVLRSHTCLLKLKLVEDDLSNRVDPFRYSFLSAFNDELSSLLESLPLLLYPDAVSGQRGRISTTRLHDLVASLPTIKYLRKQDLDVWNCLGKNAMFLQALMRNVSFWQGTANPYERFSDAERAEIKFFAMRNKTLHAILQATNKRQIKEAIASLASNFSLYIGM